MNNPHIQDADAGGTGGEKATILQPTSGPDLPPAERSRFEIDAGVVLFGIVLMLLLGIPVSMVLLRSGLLGRRSGGRAPRKRRFGRADPWRESARRVEVDVDPDDDEGAVR